MTQELHIKETLPALSFNYEQLKQWAIGLTEHYANVVVTEDAVVDVKRDMAELNKNKAKLETARKETVRRLSEPLRTFETQIKEICAIFDETYSRLGNQVKAFEDAQRDAKRKDVEGLIIEANLNAFGNPAHLDIPIQEKWLNKTTSWKVIREDLAAIIQRYTEEEQRKAALEQARRDRAAAIENHVHALNDKYGFEISVSHFVVGKFMNMDITLAEVMKRIAQYYADEHQRKQVEQKKHTSVENVETEHSSVSPKQSVQAQTRAMSIVIEYDVHNEAQIKAIIATLKPLCVNFGARYR